MRKYNLYNGAISPAVKNILQRDLKQINEKLVTDTPEFRIFAEKVHLFTMSDSFDGVIMSRTIITSYNVELILDQTMFTLQKGEKPVVRNDCGAHH